MDMLSLKASLENHQQQHLLQFWDELSTDEQKNLYEDLNSIDFDEMATIFRNATQTNNGSVSSDDKMEPIDEELCASVCDTDLETLDVYRQASFEAISRGEVGVLLLAGGQGTRLGVPYPKGMFDIGLPSKKSLYQIQMERILRLERIAIANTGNCGLIKMYIMTSEHTMAPTEEFLELNNFFGLQREQVILFEQRMIPSFDFNGKIIMDTKYSVARSPDGNGGLYWALKHENILEHLEQSGVKYLHAYCVDNVLVKVADPVFMGYAISRKAESANKVVEKAFPAEAVGVACKVDGKVQVVEYSEISNELAELRTPDGKLAFKAGNICNHFFTTHFLKKVCHEYDHMLPYHVAKKKIPYVSDSGKALKPSEPNGVKLEKFVFDVFQFSNNFLIWECIRKEEFSPLKNAENPGKKDTPRTARNSLFSLHKSYISKAGARLISNDDQVHSGEQNMTNNETNGDSSSDNPICEISPLISYAGEDLEALVKGKSLDFPIVLQ